MDKLLFDAWSEWDCARLEHPEHVPAETAPVLWFGDYPAYRSLPSSSLRLVTVGTNPGPGAFPRNEPWQNYPPVTRDTQVPDYVAAMSSYFHRCGSGDQAWFQPYHDFAVGCGYRDYAYLNGVLHTDLMSPLTTVPIWSNLPDRTQTRLSGVGINLWLRLIELLAPNLLLFSISKRQMQLLLSHPSVHVDSVGPILRIETTVDGRPRAHPWVAQGANLRWSGLSVKAIFVPKRQNPFGGLDRARIRRLGELAVRWDGGVGLPGAHELDSSSSVAERHTSFESVEALYDLVVEALVGRGVSVDVQEREQWFAFRTRVTRGTRRQIYVRWDWHECLGLTLPKDGWTFWRDILRANDFPCRETVEDVGAEYVRPFIRVPRRRTPEQVRVLGDVIACAAELG